MLMVMVAFGSTNAFASSSKTYYAKATATTTGNGKVYVGVSTDAPNEEAYQEPSAEAKSSGSTTSSNLNIVFYLFAKPNDAITKLEGWYDNAECTGEALSKDNPYRVSIQSNSTDGNNPAVKNYYAKFVEATEFYSSTITVISVGEGGSVAVSTESSNEDFGDVKSASNLKNAETVHTYYLQAKVSDAEAYRFVAWYSDETCETQLSNNANYTYQVTAESQDEAAPTQFHAYAKFEAIPYYSSALSASVEGDGSVSVGLTSNAEVELGQESSASQKVADKNAHTYYLKAQANDADRADFEGWYDGDSLLSLSTSYTYKVTVDEESVNADAQEFNVVAKFSNRNMYQVRNAGFEKWAAANEPGYGWNSFPSATGAQASLGKGMSPNPEKVEGRNGGSAVRLFSKYAGMLGIGANANGNLTTGTVNMGSMTPADASNHNYTNVEDATHRLLIEGQPDSVEFYTKYKRGEETGEYNGHAQFIIHDNYNYRDPEIEEEQEHKIGACGVDILESEDWVRNTGDFTYFWDDEAAADSVKYLLINFTTNVIPGGSRGDTLVIDDVRLIYNSEMVATVYGVDSLNFVDAKASVNALYDATKNLEVLTNGRAATVETSYNSSAALLTITVKGQDIEVNPENQHVYTIQFNKPEYSLTFSIDGETIGEGEALHEGDTITPVTVPTKEGYSFAGWDNLPETMPAEDLVVTGSYKVNSYELKFVVGEEVIKADSVAYGAEVVAPEDPTKEGHTFAGWAEVPETMPAKDVTVTGSFTVNEYNLLFVVDGDTISSAQVAYGAEISAIEEPTSEGMTFSGWSSMPKTMPADDVTVTGTFTANTYKVTYMVGDSIYASFDVQYGAAMPQAPEYTPESDDRYTREFEAWEGDEYTTMPAKDVVYTAKVNVTDGIEGIMAEQDSKVYDLKGNRVSVADARRGIYIINGKKVLKQ